jgi:hypothetical protein
MAVAYVVTVHVADKQDINITKPWITGAGDRAADVIENPGAVRVFEQDRAIEFAELAIVATKWRDLDRCSRRHPDAQCTEQPPEHPQHGP